MTRTPRDIFVLAGLYAMTLAGLAAQGLFPQPPLLFLGLILLFAVPLAYVLTHGVFLLDRVLQHRVSLLPVIGVVIGAVLISIYHFILDYVLILLLVFVLAAGVKHRGGNSGLARPILAGGPILFVGYATVWGLNYLFATLSFQRLQDPVLLQMDLTIYRWVGGLAQDPVGMFPLVRSSFLFQILENAYHILFVELFVVLFVLHAKALRFRYFLRSIFASYFIGLATFLVYPAVGPCIFLPETFDIAFHHTQTHEIMQGMYNEYRALRQGESLSGFGYFVAVPSLHVAMAVLLQVFLHPSRPHFWVFLPINILMIVSTFLLGYHYLVDAPAGILLAVVVLFGMRAVHRRERAPSSVPKSDLRVDSR